MEGICHRELGKAGWESVQGSATGFKMVRESLSLYPSSSKSLNKGGGGGAGDTDTWLQSHYFPRVGVGRR